MPLWEGFDEPFHMGHLLNMAFGRPADKLPANIAGTLSSLPLPWMLRNSDFANATTHEGFCRLPRSEQGTRRSTADASLEPTATSTIDSYERQQAPLYYWLFTPAVRLLRSTPLADGVPWLRYLGVLVASLFLPFTWLAARSIFRDEWRALLATALAVTVPELMMNLFRVSNEVPAVVLASLLLWLLVRDETSRGWVAGLVLGLALLTKAYFLAAVPAVIIGWRRKPRVLLIALIIAAAVSGWWYASNIWHGGSVTGEQSDRVAKHVWTYVGQVNWREAADSTFVSHVWFGNWSFVGVRSWMYKVMLLLYLVALVLLIGRRPHRLLAPVLLMAGMTIGLCYHVLVTYASQRASATTGWYIYAFVSCEVILLAAASKWLTVAIGTAYAALDLFGMTFYLLPYYNCVTGHGANGVLRAAKIDELERVPFGPLYVVYVIATIACAASVVYCARRSSHPAVVEP